ncbi:hypothetical protein COU00_04215 [Candidatus Falkowbacteria bacterium CG10_big_fil_rev_8_21_14_0_10_43_11]|uniref:Uncharacterized protein n=1 Tax=Candidatus Falkowbacteria bacterium CG10_big_fil_rev_8_21_14_0_10_43_11 TaxID=1974568 RepID=A0A2M6WL09_9BACT|nr:MAG: hypothetical protein COU00_04215 [Candidatus Falkowbacteria bacterium CG10_big_fil_rev_8_21_14_0_10_43_11]
MAAGRSVQNSQSGFSSKKVRISSNKHHKIKIPPAFGWEDYFLAKQIINRHAMALIIKKFYPKPSGRRKKGK